jgi:cytochrome P450
VLSPLSAVTHPDPYPYYAGLVADRPFHYDDTLRMWVASGAAQVAGILRHPHCRVRPEPEPVPRGIRGTAAGDVFGHLVRMTDGEVQRRLKTVVVEALDGTDHSAAAKSAARLTRSCLDNPAEPALAELMLAVPPRVVASLCGLDEGADEEAARLIGEFVQCIPASATAEQQEAAAVAAGRLRELMGPHVTGSDAGLLGDLVRIATGSGWSDTAPLLANGIGFLSQTYEATAGLIGNTLMALARVDAARQVPRDRLGQVVEEVARYDAPVQNTRRFAVAPFEFEGVKVEAGQAILVLLAAANRDPSVNPEPEVFRAGRPEPSVFTFGAAAHRCPGQALATAMATAVVGELLDHGFDPAGLPRDVTYRPSPNSRIPAL